MNEIGKNLKRIRLLKNLSLEKAGNLLNMSAPAVSKYEKGQIIPSSEKLIEFANAYSVKVLDLLKSYNAPEMKFNAFRKKQRLQGQNLELLKEIIQNKVSDYLKVIELNQIKSNSIKLKKYLCNIFEDAENAAENFRKDYKLSINQPISELINILENLGIVIIQIDNHNEKFSDFDGLSEVVNNIPIIILLKDNDGARQRFTIAHELGHLVLNINNEKLDEEKMCNKFAGALLMPKEAVIKEFGNSRYNISYYELKAFKMEYKISMAAIVYRLKELNIISEYLFRKINISFSSIGIKKQEPITIEPEESYQFNRLVHKLEVDNIISLNRACELLGISIDDYNNEDNNYRY
jgi:Zn-dependent peptidase ImmA (M78 family)